jgi:hypothetical protein
MAGQQTRSVVFAPEIPAIHVFGSAIEDVDARHKAGHDGVAHTLELAGNG